MSPTHAVISKDDGMIVGHGKHNWELMKDNIQVNSISCYLRLAFFPVFN